MEASGVEEWEYVAEGRHHVIVRDKHGKPPYCVLRFKKRIATHDHEVALSAHLGSEAPWVRRFLSPQYRPLRNARKIAVSRDVIAAVNAQTFEHRPVGRRQDSLCEDCESALVEPDLSRLWQTACGHYTHLYSEQTCTTSAPGVVVEIKPKNNRIIHSPFYRGASELKHTMGRYSLLQLYKSISTKMGQGVPWGHFDVVSSYEPRMMFSGNEADIRTSLRVLLENPQNNLRISIGGQHVFGWDLADNKQALCEQLMRIFQAPSCENAFDLLVECLVRVLTAEELLQQMAFLHAFDLFNVEGAAAMFQHLVELLGSEPQAFEHVRQFDRFEEVDVNSSLDSLRFQLRCDTWRLPRSADEALQMRADAQRSLESLTVDECVLALQLWLHALTVSDCSVMIALQPHLNVEPLSELLPSSQCHKSSIDRPGLLLLHPGVDRTTCDVVSYTIGVVDVELKAFEKIVSKAVDDAKICSVVAAAMRN